MRDGGAGLADPIATPVDAPSFAGAPSLREHTADLTALAGQLVRFRLLAYNAASSSASPVAQYRIATIPAKPAAVVTAVYAEPPYLNLP